MEFLTRADLLKRNGYFGRFCRNWQENRYHPSFSAFRPGETIAGDDGKSYKIDQAECDRLNAEIEKEYQQMLDTAFPEYILPSRMIERKIIAEEESNDEKFTALCQGLFDIMGQLNWTQILLISLHPPSPYLEPSHDYPPFVKARQGMEANGMPNDFKGGIVLERGEVVTYLPMLLTGVLIQAVPLAFAPPKEQAIFGAFSDRGMIYTYFSGLAEQQRFEGAAMSADLIPEPV